MKKMTINEAIQNVTAYVYYDGGKMPLDVARALDVLKDSAISLQKIENLCKQGLGLISSDKIIDIIKGSELDND